MAELLTVENLFTLMVLTALETVLGFDNLLYISIEAMSKATFYFVLVTLVLVDVVQSRYQKKIMLEERQKQLAGRAERDAAAAAR